MQPRIKIGLIAGALGALVNVGISAFSGVCGLFVSALAGAVAGFMAAQNEKAASKGEGAWLGAISGGIAGGLVIVGQIIAVYLVLLLFQNTGNINIFGQTAPSPYALPSQQTFFYPGDLVAVLYCGVVGAGPAALSGAVAGYLGTPDRQATAGPTMPGT